MFSIESIRELALTMHDSLRTIGMTEKDKPIFIAGVLVALTHEDFIAQYKTSPSFTTTVELLQNALEKKLGKNNVNREKIEDIRAKFVSIRAQS